MIDLESENIENEVKNDKLLEFIPFINETLSYHEFFTDFMINNKPCILSSSFTKEWVARKEWVTEAGTPNLEFLGDNFGHAEVPVTDCSQKYYDSQEKKTYILNDYIKYWKEIRTCTNVEEKCLYLKDWHFLKAFPNYNAYATLNYFASDWLNEFWHFREDIRDDYLFVYLGPKNSWTPLHADVFRSFSWSSNVCGRKRWLFYPPGEDVYLRDSFGTLIYNVESSELGDIARYPEAKLASGQLEVIQEAGETIFVPSCWHHQVFNLEDTISINHNWLNATNIHIVWKFLKESLEQVEFAIRDCCEMDDWIGQCQVLLKATHGMDYAEFYSLLLTIAKRRIHFLSGKGDVISFGQWKLGKNHAIYDLKNIQSCLECFLDDEHLDNLSSFHDTEIHPNELLDNIIEKLS